MTGTFEVVGRFGRRVLGLRGPSETVGHSRSKGDRARDAGQWAEAARAYRHYLRHNNADGDIWIQFGNCSKEAGNFDDALAAYDTALSLDGRNAEAHLQKGHLLKLMGRTSQSIEAFKTSLDIAPKHNPAFQELLGLGALPDESEAAAAAVETVTIYIDVTDILDYLRVNMSLSGIQRVVANLIEFAAAFEQEHPGCAIRPVFPDYNEGSVHTIRMGLLTALIDLVAIRGSRDMVDRALEAVKSSRARVTLTPADTLLIPGAFWIYQRYDLLNQLRQDGVRVAVFIHDLIQITNPEFVEPAATTVFRRSFTDVLCVASYLLSNSRFVALDITTHLRERMNFQIPVLPVTLATELGSRPVNQDAVTPDVREAIREDFVLYVSTIEVRKNHLYLIKVWEKLIADGAPWIPNLVFVGKWGWEIEDLHEHLRNSDYLGGRLMIFNGISDTDLATLYQHCKFTVYPSFAEGWGLPVGESLGYGKPCVASKTTSIPEVGGSYCVYIDPFDWMDGHRVISQVLADRPGLVDWTTRIRTTFRPKTWKAFCDELFETVIRMGRNEAMSDAGNNCLVESGDIVSFGNDALAQLDAKRGRLVTARMTRMTGWHGIEAWGCWAAKRRATLKFKTNIARGRDALLYLFLRTPEGDIAADCTIRCGDFSTVVDDLGPTPRWCTARGRVTDAGEIEVMIVSGRGYRHQHGRELFVGILSMGIAAVDDPEGRMTIVDAIVPGGLARLPAA